MMNKDALMAMSKEELVDMLMKMEGHSCKTEGEKCKTEGGSCKTA